MADWIVTGRERRAQPLILEFLNKQVVAMIKTLREDMNEPKFDVLVRKDFSPRRKRSWGGITGAGGQPFISIALIEPLLSFAYDTAIGFDEYAHIKNHPIIGSIPRVNWRKKLAAIIAHEIAHAFQYYMIFKLYKRIEVPASFSHNQPQLKREQGHGRDWQFIYSILRSKHVNDMELLHVELPPGTPNMPAPEVKIGDVGESKAVRAARIYDANVNLRSYAQIAAMVANQLMINKRAAYVLLYNIKKKRGMV